MLKFKHSRKIERISSEDEMNINYCTTFPIVDDPMEEFVVGNQIIIYEIREIFLTYFFAKN